MIPSGSNDPYALRRQTYGIVRIVEAQGWTFPFTDMQGAIVDAVNEDVLDYGIHFNRDQKNSLSSLRVVSVNGCKFTMSGMILSMRYWIPTRMI